MERFTTQHTIVQHSGYGYAGSVEFAKGLETRMVTHKAEADRITRAGGILFDDWQAAENFAEEAMYPDGYEGLTPLARGTFSHHEIDGLRIYVPVREVVG